jgi:hypothetical protein
LALGAGASGFETDPAVVGDIPKPLEMPGIALVRRLVEASGRDDPLELRTLGEQENRGSASRLASPSVTWRMRSAAPIGSPS